MSAATLSRIKSGNYQLNPRKKEFELSVLFVRLFRSLDAIVGGGDRVATEEKRAFQKMAGHAAARVDEGGIAARALPSARLSPSRVLGARMRCTWLGIRQ